MLSSLTMGLTILFYDLPPTSSATLGAIVGLVGVLVLRNREKNLRKLKGHPSVFPNPLGGGLLMLYVYRPWMRELSEIQERVEEKTLKKHFNHTKVKERGPATATRKSHGGRIR